MHYTMSELTSRQRYKILVSTVTPRPIAWVTTRSVDGVVNAAPYSFFNAVGDDPALVVLGLLHGPEEGADKDTGTHIKQTREFVVNLVAEHDMERMNLSCVDAPREVSEVEYAEIETVPASAVAAPLIASAPVSFECRLVEALAVGTHQTVVLGEVVVAHVKDEFVSDIERMHFDTPAMNLVGRMHGSGTYLRNTDQFTVPRPAYDPQRLAELRRAKD
ncbi:MAG: flavin reductase family protein [Cumulibacter sp.]